MSSAMSPNPAWWLSVPDINMARVGEQKGEA
jgi:hypothetical protein